jgi:cellulose synthase/poly-beta-1,6-N-acetylglucosamine synthase-like glycosyltransferase
MPTFSGRAIAALLGVSDIPRASSCKSVATPISSIIDMAPYQTPWPETQFAPGSSPSREICFTVAGLVVTLGAAVFTFLDIATILATWARTGAWGAAGAQVLFLLIVASLVYGSCVYHLARLGYLRRILDHVPTGDAALASVYCEASPPLITILVPSYMEDERIVRRTLLSAALQTYPRRRVVLLIDDPPAPARVRDAARLEGTRRLPVEMQRLLEVPRQVCARALEAFRQKRAANGIDITRERRRLASVHTEVAGWLERQASAYESFDHADRLFVELAFRTLARTYRVEAERLTAPLTADPRPSVNIEDIDVAYRRLVAQFDVELTSFQRKRYDNLSHEPNKAMNLNSYIALLGGTFRETVHDGKLYLERTADTDADLSVPASEFLLAVDADSILTPDYALRLVHVMREPGHENVAIVQTPYSAFPGAPSAVERIAGATTDIQCLIHQGFSRYDATYWVGANAVIRTAALGDIASYSIERGQRVVRFIQDRTLIEDTESTVDLLANGWRLSNYPGRLAFSETPADFGSLLIQRRRWANGGLIILPRLLRYVTSARVAVRLRLAQAFMMAHYLTSLAAVNIGLLFVLAFSFEDSMRTLWLPLTAVPYYLLYARDLRFAGYRVGDVLRTYALNLVLIPVNLVGVMGSLYQAVVGSKAAFGRTPKVRGRTPVPAIYLLAELGIGLQWMVRALGDTLEHRPAHALLAAVNFGFLLYGLVTFIGVRNSLDDLLPGLRARLQTCLPPMPTRARLAHHRGARQGVPSEPAATR